MAKFFDVVVAGCSVAGFIAHPVISSIIFSFEGLKIDAVGQVPNGMGLP